MVEGLVSVDGESARLRAELVRVRGEVARSVSRRCRDVHEVDDVVQESLCRALRYQRALKDGAAVLPWLVRIARNVLVDRNRSEVGRQRGDLGELGEADEPFGRELEPPDLLEPGVELWLDGEPVGLDEARGILARARGKLSIPDRAVLYEHYELGLSCRESARRQGVAPATIKVRLFRARSRLRDHLVRELRARRRRANMERGAVA